MYINIQLHKNKDFFSNSGPFFRFCKTKKPGFPGFRTRCAAFAVAGNRKRLRRPSNPLSGRTRAFALANSKKTSFAQAKVAACAHAKIPCPRFLIKIDILEFFGKNNSKIYNKILKTLKSLKNPNNRLFYIFLLYDYIITDIFITKKYLQKQEEFKNEKKFF